MPRNSSPAVIEAARNRPTRPRPERRHEDYEVRLELIAKRRAEGRTYREIAAELGLCRQRVMALADLLESRCTGQGREPGA